jgi:hypothetical protein
VLPGLASPAPDLHEQRMSAFRVWLRDTLIPELRNQGKHIVVVDWRPLARTPGILDTDGIHLARDPNGPWGLRQASGDAREQLIVEGMNHCYD